MAGWRGANFKLDLSRTESVRLRSLLKISRGPHLGGGGALGGWQHMVVEAPGRAFVKF